MAFHEPDSMTNLQPIFYGDVTSKEVALKAVFMSKTSYFVENMMTILDPQTHTYTQRNHSLSITRQSSFHQLSVWSNILQITSPKLLPNKF